MPDTLLLVLDLLGTFAFALNGALTAVRPRRRGELFAHLRQIVGEVITVCAHSGDPAGA